jgi:hypothetical protein
MDQIDALSNSPIEELGQSPIDRLDPSNLSEEARVRLGQAAGGVAE